MNTITPQSPAAGSASTNAHEALAQHDLDEGTQPADINAIGYTASRFPLSKVIFFAVVAILVLAVLFLLGKSWFFSKFTAPARPPQQEGSASPSEGSQSAKRPRLPDANTPLDGNPLSTGADTSSASAPAKDATPGAPSKLPDTACPSTALVDKRSGQTVRDAQGQPVMVDCKGVILSAARIPAPAVNPYAIGSTPSATATGQPAPVAVDRYSGDTSLVSKKTPLAPITGMPTVNTTLGTLPPPPVSSADLEARLKRLMTPVAQTPNAAATNPILASPSANAAGNPQGAMGGLLSPTSTPKALAMRTFDPNLTIPKGDAINCAMTTRVVTEISGFTSCIVSENVYSANGKVLLIERMSEIQGEYTAVGQPGQRRVYVLWSRVRKPGGITIDIASPSTDSLGAAGIDGIVDNRWFERIGSAYMLSIFKDFLAANAASTAGGAAGVNTPTGAALYQNSINTSTSLAEKVLSQSMNIKPVVYAHQGERIAIYVARDLDFSGIYQVTPVERKP